MSNPFEQHLDYEVENKNNMAFWFPLLKQIRMKVPKTILVDTGYCDLGSLAEGEMPDDYYTFLDRLKAAIAEIGLPCFLRTGMTSNKHDWKDSCFIESDDNKYLTKHIASIVETSFMANIAGMALDYSLWAVREMIPTTPIITSFRDMPIVKERRLFISDGVVLCNHPYWVKEAFESRGGISKENMDKLEALEEKDKEIEKMAQYVGRFLKGYWSVDFLQDKDGGWWLTDMAVGSRSYHHPDCKINKKEQ